MHTRQGRTAEATSVTTTLDRGPLVQNIARPRITPMPSMRTVTSPFPPQSVMDRRQNVEDAAKQAVPFPPQSVVENRKNIDNAAKQAAPVAPAMSQTPSNGGPDLRKWTDEDLQKRIQRLENGLRTNGKPAPQALSQTSDTGRKMPVEVNQHGLQPLPFSPPAAPLSLFAGTAPSISKSTGGGVSTRTSSPAPPESTCDAGNSRTRSSTPDPQALEAQLSVKERQVVELRAQIARCERQLYRDAHQEQPENATSEDPERTGPRSPTPSSAGTAATPSLDGELAWIVTQMEVHRRQIQAHQKQLSSLEKRHAEIVAVIASQNLASRGSPASLAAEPRMEPFGDEPPSLDSILRHTDIPSRPASASSSISMNSANRSSFRQPISVRPSRAARPTSAGSNASLGSATSNTSGPARNPFAPQPGSEVGFTSRLGSDVNRMLSASVSNRSTSPGSRSGFAEDTAVEPVATSRFATNQTDVVSKSQRSNGSFIAPGPASDSGSHQTYGASRMFGKAYETERIVQLVRQFEARRPLTTPFLPVDVQTDSEGRAYMHGSLEVRLFLSEDGNRLLVRVGSGLAGIGGRTMEIDDFVTRAESIAAKRSLRPNPIAEETEPLSGLANAPAPGSLASEAREGINPSSSLRALLGNSKESSTSTSSSALPWKKLFKSHWGPK